MRVPAMHRRAARCSGDGAGQQIEKRDVHIAVGGKIGALLPAAHDHRAPGLLQGRGARTSSISDFAGGARSLQAVVGGSADVVVGRLRAHHQHAVAQARTSSAFVLTGAAPQIAVAHLDQACREVQVAQGPEGHEDRRERAGLVRPTW